MEDLSKNIVKKTKIKHIVISGGGIIFLPFYGVLREAQKRNIWNYDELQSIYGTSAGSLLGTIALLNLKWEDIDEYIIQRPWAKVFSIQLQELFTVGKNCGLKNIELIKSILSPLFGAKNISMDITMKEFYELNHIDFHIFITKLDNFTSIDINHKDYPDWKLVEAVYCSCCVPIIFCPFVKDNTYYIDGGLLNNFPLLNCINENQCNNEEILSLDINVPSTKKENILDFFQFLFLLFIRIFQHLTNRKIIPILSNTIKVHFVDTSLSNLSKIIELPEKRSELIENGSKLISEHDIYKTF